MARKKQIKSKLTPEQAQKVLAEIAVATAKKKEMIGAMEQEIAEIRQAFASDLAIQDTVIDLKGKELELYMQTNREKLLTGDKKSLDFSNGRLGFRDTTPKVGQISGCKVAISLDLIKVKMPDYLDTKESISKARILADYNNAENKLDDAALKEVGLKVTQKENFFIELKEENTSK